MSSSRSTSSAPLVFHHHASGPAARMQNQRSSQSQELRFQIQIDTIMPAWKLQRLSISLKLSNFFLRVNSESTVHQRTKQNSESTDLVSRRHPQQRKQHLKSRFLKIINKLRIWRSKKPRYPEAESSLNQLKQFAYEETVKTVLLWSIKIQYFCSSFKLKKKIWAGNHFCGYFDD
ncbi:uncharacterized protein LOC126594044 [Malus sylvestris]|uniref:uncharacterized protein LOC126594044 n=1 Tax=Malus sylvestris TaxID=3752 RepID=UPI0021ABC315|nr:uncharacterized protein LOC126594044 [Malus sylvestris]